MPDAVVIGAGPNGLVAANHLADAGWSVEVLEAEDRPGGAVKSSEFVEPGFVNDEFSAFYPLAVASPEFRRLRLEDYGLRWVHGPLTLAHPSSEGPAVALSRDLDETAAFLDRFAPGDGDGWRGLYALWPKAGEVLLDAMMTPFPPVRAGARLLANLGPHGLLDFTRMGVLPVRRFWAEHFEGEGAARLIAGNTLHADLLPESTGGGFFGWFLMCLGQKYGFPFPEGGAGNLTAALVRRLEARGGRVTCDARVTDIVVHRGRAVAARTAAGDVPARRAILADVDAASLYFDLLPREAVPRRVLDAMARFEFDLATFKLDWTLDGPIPWTAEEARRSPVVHVADSIDELSVTASELARRLVPSQPFLVVGQYGLADGTRAPEGKDTAWAYTHLPQGASWEGLAERMEARLEALAPGFGSVVRQRRVWTPDDLEAADSNLRGGALNLGTAQAHQQVVFRPIPGLARPETPVAGLYLASASAHPGGGVHGGPGVIAAKAALHADRAKKAVVAFGALATVAALRRKTR